MCYSPSLRCAHQVNAKKVMVKVTGALFGARALTAIAYLSKR